MSTLSNSNNMAIPSFHDFKKQASFFLKDKIKTARLALTDVTHAELLIEEATNGNSWAPDTRIMGSISKAAFEVDDYWRIVEILHKRFVRFDRKNWRVSYNSLIVLEHLLTHGPESVAEEFQCDRNVIKEIESFQYIDEKGYNWGFAVRKKSERILKLLEKGSLLKTERDRARKLTRGIQGFGSFVQRSSSSSTSGVLRESFVPDFGRCNSQYNEHGDQENHSSFSNEEVLKTDGLNLNSQKLEKKVETSLKENMAPEIEELEKKPLLGDKKDEQRIDISMAKDHPFNETENQNTASLLCT